MPRVFHFLVNIPRMLYLSRRSNPARHLRLSPATWAKLFLYAPFAVTQKTLSVVIPALNEQHSIVQIITRVRGTKTALAKAAILLEIVVVDDGSQDTTAALASQCPDTRVMRHPTNRGYGAAIKTGFRHASGEYLAFLDADGTYPPEALPELCCALENENADLVVGSRMSGAASEMPFTRRVGNFAFARMLSLLSGVRVRDSASGMRVLKREILPQLYPLPNGLDFTPAMTTRALNEELKVIEVPIAYAERLGRSKLSVVRDGVRFTNTIVWTTMTYRPVRVWGGLGLALGSLALVLAVLLGLDSLTGGTLLGTRSSFVAFTMLVLGALGTTIFSLGVMFSYLIAIFTHKPVRRGMFGRVIFNPPLDYYFGRIGGFTALIGIFVSGITFAILTSGGSIGELWFWLLLSSLLIVVGVLLCMSFLVIRVLDELALREATTQRELAETDTSAQVDPTVNVVNA